VRHRAAAQARPHRTAAAAGPDRTGAEAIPEDTMKLHYRALPAILTVALSCLAGAAAPRALAADAAPAKTYRMVQQSYATPEDAVQSLVAAVRSGDTKRIHQVLGPGSGKLIHSGDPVADEQGRDRFVAAYEKQSKIEPDGTAKATLLIGDNDWPFPFPLVKRAQGWKFDARSGADEILNRRIGRNELAAIQVCLAYVDAQREYALTEGNRNGLHEYAMKLVSTSGRRDGLYWPSPDGEPLSPLGPLAAKARAEGYGKRENAASEPYHGYFYRILTGQGSDASGGGYSYVVDGKMIGGFALVAYPARWGASGVMTFIVNHDGAVYQRNLGKGTAALALGMTRFNPDSTWSKVEP
jgi:hypothetical protein